MMINIIMNSIFLVKLLINMHINIIQIKNGKDKVQD